MKKVLYIISNPFSFSRRSVGGNISSASGVIRGFVALGYHVDVVSDSPVPTVSDDTEGITMHYYPLGRIRSWIPVLQRGFFARLTLKLDSLLFQLVMKSKISKMLEFNHYHLSYMRASFNGHAVVKLFDASPIPLIIEVNKPLSMGIYNNSDSLKWPKEGQKIKVPRAEREQYRVARLISVDSSIRAKWILNFVSPSNKHKVLVNPNGVDTAMFAPSKPDKKIKDALGFSSDDILVGMASSFRWYNDIDEMCQILKYVVNQNRRIKFLLITADKNKAQELRTLMLKYEITKYVKICVQIPFKDMPKYLNCCDILMSHFNFHGKWAHNCSIKHLEYLSLAKPSVATDVGEVNFAIEHEINGLLCEEGNVTQFGDSIIRLGKNVKLRERLGLAGRGKAVRELSWDANVQRIIDMIPNGGIK